MTALGIISLTLVLGPWAICFGAALIAALCGGRFAEGIGKASRWQA